MRLHPSLMGKKCVGFLYGIEGELIAGPVAINTYNNSVECIEVPRLKATPFTMEISKEIGPISDNIMIDRYYLEEYRYTNEQDCVHLYYRRRKI